MGVLSRAEDCTPPSTESLLSVSGVVNFIRRASKTTSTYELKEMPHESHHTPLVFERLELSNNLPAYLAGKLRAPSGDCTSRCALAGSAGPVYGVLFGAAAAAGAAVEVRETFHANARREMIQLSNRLGVASQDIANKMLRPTQSSRPDALELALAWCASPAIPTYGVGVHLVLGDADVSSLGHAATCARMVRLLCTRGGVTLADQAPMLAAIAEALCEAANPYEGISAIIDPAQEFNLRESLASKSDNNVAQRVLEVRRINSSTRRHASK